MAEALRFEDRVYVIYATTISTQATSKAPRSAIVTTLANEFRFE